MFDVLSAVSLTDIFIITGVEDYTDLKVNSGTENIKIADGAVPVLESVVLK